MTSVANFDTWKNSSGTTHSHVVQTVFNKWSDSTSATAQSWTDLAGSQFTITTKVANSRIYLHHNGSSYGTATTSGFGIQFYRVSPSAAEIWTPFATWGATGHDRATSNFGGGYNIHYMDSPNVAAGTTITYKLRAWVYAAGGLVYFSYPGSYQNYRMSASVMAYEIAP